MHLFGFAVPMDAPFKASGQMLRLSSGQTLVLPGNRSTVFPSKQSVARSHRSVRVSSKKGTSPSHAEGMARVTTELRLIREGFQKVEDKVDKLEGKVEAAITKVEDKVDKLEGKVEAAITKVEDKVDKLDSKLDTFMMALLVAAIGIIGVFLSK